MKINRIELLEKLKLVQPALATKPIVEELVHLWFDGNVVYAYNESIGIEVPFKSELRGGIRGDLLIGILEKSRARDVELTWEEDQLFCRAANARLELSCLPLERSVWQFPTYEKSISFKLTSEFLSGIKALAVSIGTDTSVRDQLGITVIPNGTGSDLFTTDSRTLSWVRFSNLSLGSNRYVLSEVFCEQVLRLFKVGGKLSSVLDFVVAEDNSGVRLFGGLVDVDSPLDFVGRLKQLHSDEELIALPNRLSLALERAKLIVEGKQGSSAEFILDQNFLRIKAESPVGTLNDAMKVEGNHPSCLGLFNPDLIKRVLPQVVTFRFNSDVMVLTGPENFVHIIAAN